MPFAAAATVVGAGAAYASAENQADAAADASRGQRAAAHASADEAREARNQMRSDLYGYQQLGKDTLPIYQNLLLNPQAQVDYLKNNPTYQYGVDQATKALFANSAARGKLGSGGTAAALTDRVLGMGEQFLNNRYQNLLQPLQIGQNSAAQVGTAGLNAANMIGNALQTGAANAGQFGMQGAGYQADALNYGAQAVGGLLNYFKPSQQPTQGYGYDGSMQSANAFANYA